MCTHKAAEYFVFNFHYPNVYLGQYTKVGRAPKFIAADQSDNV